MDFTDLKMILVPTDFSDASSGALHTAIRLAQAFHTTIDILHVDPDPTFVMPPPGDLLTVPLVMESMAAPSPRLVVGQSRFDQHGTGRVLHDLLGDAAEEDMA